ncbi:Histidine ammonia-lyase [Serratia fonticola]|uniref:Histidine ammonia-lyase n=1 Tax=Serratia fonticola TaxID=47917 RepID=A0A4V6KVI2_SERFO|nr:Histidine ammonia-lyase [Serratia fonticola]
MLLGEGKAPLSGRVATSHRGAGQSGLKPLTLAAKEGLALLNGTQVSAAFCAAWPCLMPKICLLRHRNRQPDRGSRAGIS